MTANRNRFAITVAVMSATVMQVLDTTIVNVALPHMQGSLSAAPDQISWVLTSYLVSSAIFMPLTGYFADRFGQRRVLMLSISGFVMASLLCGLSTHLSEIVLFRLLQGITGAALVPISQAVMVATFAAEDRGKAMAIWGIGVMVGPILGPTLGGLLTEWYSWRWTFFINLPVGLFSLALSWRYIPDSQSQARKMDWTGLGLLSLGIGALQFVLDRGSQDDWFASFTIQYAAYLCAIGFIGYAWWASRAHDHALFRTALFKDRNFITASSLMAFLGLGLFGSTLLQPLLLEGLMGYPTLTTGLTLAPRGLASMFSMMIVGRLINRVDPRYLIALGIATFCSGSWLTTHYTLSMTLYWLITPMLLQGMGLGMVFIPLSTLAYSTLPKQYAAEAAGLFSLTRTIGSSIGVSLVASVLTHQSQASWQLLGRHLQADNPAVQHYLSALQLNSDSPLAAGVLAQVLSQQAHMIGFLDAFWFVTIAFAGMLPLVLLLRHKATQNAAT